MIKEPDYQVPKINSLKDLLNSSAELFNSKNAFLTKGAGGSYEGVTYSQFQNDVNSLGTALVNLGLNGKRIAIIGENRYEWCLSYMSIVCGTGIVVPLDKELPDEEIENLLRRSKSSAVFFSKRYSEQIEKISKNIDSLDYFIGMDSETENGKFLSLSNLLNKGSEFLSSGNTDFISSDIDNESLGILLFTSGTTDLAKGVMLSHKNICSDIVAVCSVIHISKNDKCLSLLPLHHTYECTCGFLLMIYSGVTIAFSEGYKHIAKNMKEVTPSILITVPLILEKLHKRIWDNVTKQGLTKKIKLLMKISNFIYNYLGIDIRKKLFKKIHDGVGGNIRLIVTGAAGIDPEVMGDFKAFGLKILQGYGLTECSPIVSVNHENDVIDSSIGIALPGVDVKIDSPDENGIGEIIVHGNNVMLGYFENESATHSVIKDNWFHTGDLGRIDKSGHIFFTGRKKNVIVTKNGKNIFPEEVELYLNRSPFILESVVSGKEIKNNDELLVEAHIVPDFEKIKTTLNASEISQSDIEKIISQEIKNINKLLPFYKKVKKFHIREEEFEKTTTKKIKRTNVK